MPFNSKMVSKITGVSYKRIVDWDKSNFITPSVNEASGRGSTRLYSFADIVQFKVAKLLIDKGFSLGMLKRAIRYLKNNIPDVEKPQPELRFLTDGSSVFVITGDDQVVMDVLKGDGRTVLLHMKIGEIVWQLKDELNQIQQDVKYTEKMGSNLHC